MSSGETIFTLRKSETAAVARPATLYRRLELNPESQHCRSQGHALLSSGFGGVNVGSREDREKLGSANKHRVGLTLEDRLDRESGTNLLSRR